jgi:hypothetical protein
LNIFISSKFKFKLPLNINAIIWITIFIQSLQYLGNFYCCWLDPTFESISTQEALNRLKISGGKLEIMPESTSAVNDSNILDNCD